MLQDCCSISLGQSLGLRNTFVVRSVTTCSPEPRREMRCMSFWGFADWTSTRSLANTPVHTHTLSRGAIGLFVEGPSVGAERVGIYGVKGPVTMRGAHYPLT